MPPKRAAAKRKYTEAASEDDEDAGTTEGKEPAAKKQKTTNLGTWKELEGGLLIVFKPKQETTSTMVAGFDFVIFICKFIHIRMILWFAQNLAKVLPPMPMIGKSGMTRSSPSCKKSTIKATKL